VVFWRGRLTGGISGTAINFPAGFRPSIPPTEHTWALGSNSTTSTTVRTLNASPGQLTLSSGTAPNLVNLIYIADA
jgi:hypothetical protein